MTTEQIAVIAVTSIACVTDLRDRRIPNWLTFGAAAGGFLYSAAVGGWSGLGAAGAGWLLGLAIFFVPFALGGLGGGDLKLLAALGAWLGPIEVAWVAAFTCMAGAMLGLIVAFSTGYLRKALSNIWVLLMHWRILGLQPHPELTIQESKAPKLAYGIAIFTGTMVTVWIH